MAENLKMGSFRNLSQPGGGKNSVSLLRDRSGQVGMFFKDRNLGRVGSWTMKFIEVKFQAEAKIALSCPVFLFVDFCGFLFC